LGEKIIMNRRTYFRFIVIAAGVLLFASIAYHLPFGRIDMRFFLLSLIAVLGASWLAVPIPGIEGRITVSDTIVFLILLLYGGEAAIAVAALEGVTSSLRISRRPITILFNASVMAVSLLTGVFTVRLFFGYVLETTPHVATGRLVGALAVLSLVHYFVNSGLVSIDRSLKTGSSILATWRKHYLWTSLTYFAGALAAGTVARLIAAFGFYSVFLTMPIIAIVYFTYRAYMNSVASAEEQAEQAALSIEEKKRYISELEMARKELHESSEYFRHASLHDRLTSLPNRALLADRLQQSINRARRRKDYLFAVLFLDLDRFKIINDSLGHAAGDELLVTVAHRLNKCLRAVDTVARLGGDEFAVLLDDIQDTVEALHIAQRLQDEIKLPVMLEGEEVFVTASIGIALNLSGHDNPESILRDADSAMYQAKQNGKGRHELFDKNIHTRALMLLKLENQLRGALKRHEFFLCYQPIVSIDSGSIKGFEALIRWQHPERGVVLPSEFIFIAEEAGLTADIGAWVLSEACNQLVRWREQGLRDCFVSVNLSATQFADTGLAAHVNQILEQNSLDPALLHLEITESVVMDNAEKACVTLNQLRTLGVQLSIDDFGTGYSSLSYLARFPINKLKIDRSFIGEMMTSDETLEVVRAIVTLAATLNIEVVAEGVETQEQRQILNALNVRYAQGYLFFRPLEAARVIDLLNPAIEHAPVATELPNPVEMLYTEVQSVAVN
jgi:diguanylate cyclase (GGDEF)-like protein